MYNRYQKELTHQISVENSKFIKCQVKEGLQEFIVETFIKVNIYVSGLKCSYCDIRDAKYHIYCDESFYKNVTCGLHLSGGIQDGLLWSWFKYGVE